MQNPNQSIKFAFFGGEPLAVPTLEKLSHAGFLPALIVSNPDRPQGRNLKIASPPTAIWAKEHGLPLLQPEKLDKQSALQLYTLNFELFVVVSYGKIIPKKILDLPKLGAINIHPSLLPLYRGPSPIIAPILNGDSETGVTIIKIDEEMDHGPILAQEKVSLAGDEFIEDLEKKLSDVGGELLVKILPEYFSGKIKPAEQDHANATYVKKITKAEGEISLSDDGIKNWRKFRAFQNGPRVYFFENGKRMIVTDAALEDGKFVVKKIIPEGGKEVAYRIT